MASRRLAISAAFGTPPILLAAPSPETSTSWHIPVEDLEDVAAYLKPMENGPTRAEEEEERRVAVETKRLEDMRDQTEDLSLENKIRTWRGRMIEGRIANRLYLA